MGLIFSVNYGGAKLDSQKVKASTEENHWGGQTENSVCPSQVPTAFVHIVWEEF